MAIPLPRLDLPMLDLFAEVTDDAMKTINGSPAPAGVKDDAGKLRHSLVDLDALNEMVAVLTHGAEKYAPGNWRHVKDWEDRYFESTIRHLIADRQGEHVDKDTGGLLALACAACGVHFLLAMRLAQHPELRASLNERLRASIAKARALKNEREAKKRELEDEITRAVMGEVGLAQHPAELRQRIKELTNEIDRLNQRSSATRRKRPRAVKSKGDRRRSRAR